MWRGSRVPGAKLAMFAVVGLACATNPVTGKRELTLVSEGQEIELGTRHYPPTRQAQGGDYVVDPAVTAFVQAVGQKLAAASDRPRQADSARPD